MMRCLVVLAIVAAPSAGRADSFLELGGGMTLPTGDSDWTNLAESSPRLGLAAGAYGTSDVGGMVRADWTPVTLDNMGGSFGGLGGSDISGHRFRVLADVAFRHFVTPKLAIAARAGAGIDIAHASATVTVLGTTTSSSDTDVGYVFELAGGVWFGVGGGVQLGGELGLPIGHHGKRGNGADGNYTFDYTSVDLDITFGVRLVSR